MSVKNRAVVRLGLHYDDRDNPRTITRYGSISEAATAICKKHGTGKFRKNHATVASRISRAANGKSLTAYGNEWQYVADFETWKALQDEWAANFRGKNKVWRTPILTGVVAESNALLQ